MRSKLIPSARKRPSRELWSGEKIRLLGTAAIMISLFGWSLALRGVVLLAAPQLIARGAAVALTMVPVVQIGFGLWPTDVGWIAKPSVAS
jgi:hypothetical protein